MTRFSLTSRLLVFCSFLALLSQLGLTHGKDTLCRSKKFKHHRLHKNKNPVISAYYPGYNAKFLPVDKIQWKMYNHLQYFVAVPSDNPEADLVIDTEQNMIEVISGAKANNVSISLSVGGWTGSRFISSLVGDKKNRTAFVETLDRAVKKYHLDGLDLDWEYPNFQAIGCNVINKNDTANFLEFLKLLRAKLGVKARLSAAVSVHGFMSPDGTNYLNDTSGFGDVLDFFTIMAYDVYGAAFSKLAGPNAPLFDTCLEPIQRFSVAQAIRKWTSSGIPARKLVLGIPGYGYGYTLNSTELKPTQFSGIPGVTSKLLQPTTGVVPPGGKTAAQAVGTDVCGKPNVAGGQWLFRELAETGKLSADSKKGSGGYKRRFDKCSGTPFLFNPSTRHLISYDDPASLKKKAVYARTHGLAGVELFDATGDTADSQLMKSVRQVFL